MRRGLQLLFPGANPETNQVAKAETPPLSSPSRWYWNRYDAPRIVRRTVLLPPTCRCRPRLMKETARAGALVASLPSRFLRLAETAEGRTRFARKLISSLGTSRDKWLSMRSTRLCFSGKRWIKTRGLAKYSQTFGVSKIDSRSPRSSPINPRIALALGPCSRSRSASILLAIGKQLARRDDALPRGLIRRIAFRSDKLSRRGPEGPESQKEARERGGRCSRYLPDSVFSYVKDARSASGRSGRSRARDD